MTSSDFPAKFPPQPKPYKRCAWRPATTQPQAFPTRGAIRPPPVDGQRHAVLPWPAMQRGSTPRRSAGSGRHPLPCQSNTAAGLPLKNKKRICRGGVRRGVDSTVLDSLVLNRSRGIHSSKSTHFKDIANKKSATFWSCWVHYIGVIT